MCYDLSIWKASQKNLYIASAFNLCWAGSLYADFMDIVKLKCQLSQLLRKECDLNFWTKVNQKLGLSESCAQMFLQFNYY